MGKPLFRCAAEWCNEEDAKHLLAGANLQEAKGFKNRPAGEGSLAAPSTGDKAMQKQEAKAPWSQAAMKWCAKEKGVESPLELEHVSQPSTVEGVSPEQRTLQQYPERAAEDTQAANGHAAATGSTKTSSAVCCLWLEGKCPFKTSHQLWKNLYLHEDVPGMPCGFKDACKFQHYKTRALPANKSASHPLTCQSAAAAQRHPEGDVPTQAGIFLEVGMMVFLDDNWKYAFPISQYL